MDLPASALPSPYSTLLMQTPARFASLWTLLDLCLLPTRPTRLDVDAAAATFRATFLANRKAAFVLNQCPATRRDPRVGEAAKELLRLGVLAEPKLAARNDFPDAIAAGLGVTEGTSAPARRRRKSRPCGTGLVPAADARIP